MRLFFCFLFVWLILKNKCSLTINICLLLSIIMAKIKQMCKRHILRMHLFMVNCQDYISSGFLGRPLHWIWRVSQYENIEGSSIFCYSWANPCFWKGIIVLYSSLLESKCLIFVDIFKKLFARIFLHHA